MCNCHQGCKFSGNCLNTGFHEAQSPALLFIFSPFWRLLAQILALFQAFSLRSAYIRVSWNKPPNVNEIGDMSRHRLAPLASSFQYVVCMCTEAGACVRGWTTWLFGGLTRRLLVNPPNSQVVHPVLSKCNNQIVLKCSNQSRIYRWVCNCINNSMER